MLKDQRRSTEVSITTQRDQSIEYLCPSARCEEGAILLGIVGEDGIVGYVTPRLIVNSEFVHQAHEGRAPEKRFRFSQPCIKSGCQQWTGSRCGLIDRVLNAIQEADTPNWSARTMPKCSIRPGCRWFAQAGPKACTGCPFVITNVRSDDQSTDIIIG